MTAVARMAVLDMRTVAPYRNQGLAVLAVVTVILANQPARLVPAVTLLVTSTVATYPLAVADKAGLETLYAVLPVPRRSVLLGHYAWALASFATTVVLGTALTLLFAAFQHSTPSGHTLLTMITLAWVLFAVNISIQLPVLIRWGYTRMGVWTTTVPLALIMGVVIKFHLDVAALERLLPAAWPAGVALISVSAELATVLDRRR
jgi:hypothetical protein